MSPPLTIQAERVLRDRQDREAEHRAEAGRRGRTATHLVRARVEAAAAAQREVGTTTGYAQP